MRGALATAGPATTELASGLMATVALMMLGCATTASDLEERLSSVSALVDARQTLRSGGPEVVYLQREVQGLIGLKADEARASSHYIVKLVRWQQDGGSQLIAHPVPPEARLTRLIARRIDADGAVHAIRSASDSLPRADPNPAFPGQLRWSARFDGVQAGDILEVVALFTIPGTLTSDTQWLGMHDGPTAQVLFKYNVPPGGRAAFQSGDSSAKATHAETPDGQILGLFTQGQPAASEGAGYARFVLPSANIRGHRHQWASSWAAVTKPYSAELLTRSSSLRGNHFAPFRPRGEVTDMALAATQWVRDRIQRADALKATWRDGGLLPNRVTTNNLNATDKVNLLHWVLESHGITHRVAAARSGALAPLNLALPEPEAFDGVLIYLPERQLWIDPSCQTCEPGEVHPRFHGGAAMLLPFKRGERPLTLPGPEAGAPPEPTNR